MEMGSWNDLHSPILFFYVVKGQPNSRTIIRMHRPIICVLVPADSGTTEQLFDEETTCPAIEIGSKNPFDKIMDLLIHDDLIEIIASFMPFTYVLCGLARPQQGKQTRQF